LYIKNIIYTFNLIKLYNAMTNLLRNLIILSFCTPIILLFFQSCEITSDITVESSGSEQDNSLTHLEGTLDFKSSKEFFDLGSKLFEMSSQERINWEKSNNYVSFRTYYEEALNELEKAEVAESKEAYENVLTLYSDVIKLNGDIIEPVLDYPYQLYCNRKGIYTI